MNKTMIKNLKRALLLLLISTILYSCSSKVQNTETLESKQISNTSTSVEIVTTKAETIESPDNAELFILNIPIEEEIKYGGVYIKNTIEEFNNLGFEYGDSLNITFSNGYEVLDLPYYSGYYNKAGEPLLVGYHGYKYIDLCITFGDRMWEEGNFKEGDTANIYLNQKAKFLNNQKLMDITYTDNRNDYSSDEVFANFRNVNTSFIKDNILYRGASPIDNKHNRAKYANELMEKANIQYAIDLSDTEEDLKKHFAKDDFKSDYYKTLYDNKKISLSIMSPNYKSEAFTKMVVKVMTDMSKNDGPYYVHCVEGKDRTGFLCMIIEGLAGASYEEIIADYMKTFENYYNVTESNNKAKYDTLKANSIDDMLRYLAGEENKDVDLKDINWANVIGRYLTDNGLDINDMENWYKKLTK